MILHTAVFGSGDPILFLHTGLQTGLTDFKYQQKHFAQSHQVILPDLRGHGLSVCNDFQDYFLNAATDIKDTLESLNISSCHIVGCSIGAIVGFYVAKIFPHLVNSLTLSGITPNKPSNWDQINENEITKQQALLSDEKMIAHFNSIHDEWCWKSLLEINKDNEWYPFDDLSNVTHLTNLPVMIIVGEGNPSEVNGAMYYREYLSEIHTAVLPFASHQVHNEQPELYSMILQNFISTIKVKEKERNI